MDKDGERHTAKLAWRALALLQTELEEAAGWSPSGNEDGHALPQEPVGPLYPPLTEADINGEFRLRNGATCTIGRCGPDRDYPNHVFRGGWSTVGYSDHRGYTYKPDGRYNATDTDSPWDIVERLPRG